MKVSRISGTVAATVAISLSSIAISSASLQPRIAHSTYALGSAKKCKVDFVKKTESHTVSVKVKTKTGSKFERKVERYVACVYVVPLKAIAPAPKPVDPPTVVTLTTNDNPATTGDTVTYTVTVASTTIPDTSGQIEVTDNGVNVPGCFPIKATTYNQNGTFVGACSGIYNSSGTHTIDGIFTGDQVYAQSAGTLTEVINDPAPVTIPTGTTGPAGPSGTTGAAGTGGSGGGTSTTTTVPAPTPTTLPPPAATVTTVTPSLILQGPGVDLLGLQATVTANGVPVTVSGTQLSYTLFDGQTAIGTYAGTNITPPQCVFNVYFARVEIYASTDYCVGSTAVMSLTDFNAGDLTVTVTYVGSPTYAPSTSSPVPA